jgi:hypothetical protein
MARKQKPRSDKPRQKNVVSGSDGATDSQRTKALILSALTAGGVFQMNSWQVQAHANRSSHSVATFATPYFSPNDYVLMRRSLSMPNDALVREMIDIRRSLAATPRRLSTTEVTTLEQRRNAIEERLRSDAPPQVVTMLRSGDISGAVASIEGEGFPERVLGDYMWALLDVAYLTRSDPATPLDTKTFDAIAAPAMDYSQQVLRTIPKGTVPPQDLAAKERAAEILHNIASFTVEEQNPSEADLKRALDAAQRALQVRQELKQPLATMRAYWMLGEVQRRAGQRDAATQSLNVALRQATTLKDRSGVAWANHSLARIAREAGDPADAKRHEAAARAIVKELAGKDTSIDFLRLEMERGD